MIDFPCHCGQLFSVPADMAGEPIQCPQCGRLNDVPLLSDLDHLDEAGNYKLDAAPIPVDPEDHIARATEAFTRDLYDAYGNPIDLRGPASGEVVELPEELLGLVPPPAALEPIPDSSTVPKYDPLTGELIRELEIKVDPVPKQQGVPTARLVYTTPTVVHGMDVPDAFEAFSIPLRLLRPMNLLVMGFVLLAHLVQQVMMTAIFFGYILMAPFWLLFQGFIIAHFANVIDETGPESRPELPAPLRYMSWHEDTFGPFCQVMLAVAVCYAPALLMLLSLGTMPRIMILPITAILALIGTILFPAALLATTTSGTILNARPDRLVGVAVVCGIEYLLSLFLGIPALIVWLSGLYAITLVAASVAQADIPMPPFLNWYIACGVLLVGIFLMHFFCWHLGILYRKHHARFPWVLQRHPGRVHDASSGFPVEKARRRRRNPSPYAGSVKPPVSGSATNAPVRVEKI